LVRREWERAVPSGRLCSSLGRKSFQRNGPSTDGLLSIAALIPLRLRNAKTNKPIAEAMNVPIVQAKRKSTVRPSGLGQHVEAPARVSTHRGPDGLRPVKIDRRPPTKRKPPGKATRLQLTSASRGARAPGLLSVRPIQKRGFRSVRIELPSRTEDRPATLAELFAARTTPSGLLAGRVVAYASGYAEMGRPQAFTGSGHCAAVARARVHPAHGGHAAAAGQAHRRPPARLRSRE
jgi:hypothetical protein